MKKNWLNVKSKQTIPAKCKDQKVQNTKTFKQNKIEEQHNIAKCKKIRRVNSNNSCNSFVYTFCKILQVTKLMKCSHPCELLNISNNCKIASKLRQLLYAQIVNSNVALEINIFCLHNGHFLFTLLQSTTFACTCKGYPHKIQTFHNTNRTKYNTKIKKIQT